VETKEQALAGRATEWTPERDRLALDLYRRHPQHSRRVANRLGVEMDEFQRLCGLPALISSPSDTPADGK
jgi:hypothetical protein